MREPVCLLIVKTLTNELNYYIDAVKSNYKRRHKEILGEYYFWLFWNFHVF